MYGSVLVLISCRSNVTVPKGEAFIAAAAAAAADIEKCISIGIVKLRSKSERLTLANVDARMKVKASRSDNCSGLSAISQASQGESLSEGDDLSAISIRECVSDCSERIASERGQNSERWFFAA